MRKKEKEKEMKSSLSFTILKSISRKMKTNHVFIKNNVGSQKKYNKELLAIMRALMKIIPIGCYQKVQSLDRL